MSFYYPDKTFPAYGGASLSIVERADPIPYDLAFVFPVVAVAQPATAHDIIDELGGLQFNWDGYGGLPITPESRISAHRLMNVAAPAMLSPEISPSSNGTIALEWKSNDGDAYIEIGRTRYSGHIQRKQGPTVYLEGQSQLLGQEELAFIKQLLYASVRSQPPTNSTKIIESAV